MFETWDELAIARSANNLKNMINIKINLAELGELV